MTNKNPLAIISGGARGIGLATAHQLASQDYRIVVIDGPTSSTMPYALSSTSELEAIHDERITPRCCDVRDPDALAVVVEDAIATYGPVHVAIASAGVLAGSPSSLALDQGQAREIFDVNYWGVVHLAAATIPSLRNTRGSFIAVSSAAGTRGLPQLGHYCGSKHAIHGFLAALAREELPNGVHINVVAPGSTETTLLEATAQVYGLATAEAFLAQQLDPNLNSPRDIAKVIGFLVTTSAQGINAAVINVDRGFIG
ncbi:MAG: SDR family oxidoreductase [Ferrimicrobium sp.]|jgi:NAD(P)-dependent dehydrogenase (short-subunit alcohol dehydrogenase family)|nr:SDR family oxidoreductase [Ferrimicrobium sp.]